MDATREHNAELASAVFTDWREVATSLKDAVDAGCEDGQVGSLGHAINPQADGGVTAALRHGMLSAAGGCHGLQNRTGETRFWQPGRRLSQRHPHVLGLKAGKSH